MCFKVTLVGAEHTPECSPADAYHQCFTVLTQDLVSGFFSTRRRKEGVREVNWPCAAKWRLQPHTTQTPYIDPSHRPPHTNADSLVK